MHETVSKSRGVAVGYGQRVTTLHSSTPDGPLGGAYFKVAESKKALDRLSNSVAAYLADRPVVVKPGAYDASGGFNVTVTIVRQPDESWALEFGAILTHARSALDYLMNPAMSRKGAAARIPTFPIYQHEHEWVEWKRRQGNSVDSNVLKFIRTVQPFRRGIVSAHRDPLMFLRLLTNTDKHDAPLVASLFAKRLIFDCPSDWIQPGNIIGGHGVVIDLAGGFHSFVRPPPDSREVTVDLDWTRSLLRVGFGSHRFELDQAAETHLAVAGAVNRLKPLLDAQSAS